MNQEIQAIAALWKREMIRFFRAKSRIIGSIGTPLFFLAILGSGLNSVFKMPMGGNYLEFITPGIIAMVLMFASMFSGITVLMDRQFGFLKETLIAPISRHSIVLGKSLGGATTAMIQGLIIMLISLFLGVHLQFGSILLLLAFMFLISLAFVALGVAIASRMQDMQGFQLVMNFLIMPVFLLSGALFPLSTAPGLLKTISLFDPLTYGVEGLRAILLGSSEISLAVSITVIAVIAIALTAIAAWFFGKIEE